VEREQRLAEPGAASQEPFSASHAQPLPAELSLRVAAARDMLPSAPHAAPIVLSKFYALPRRKRIKKKKAAEVSLSEPWPVGRSARNMEAGAGRGGLTSCKCRTDLCGGHGKEWRLFHLPAEGDRPVSRRSRCCLGMAVLRARRPEISRPPKSKGSMLKAALEPTGIPPASRARMQEAEPQPEGVHPSLLGGVNLGPKSRLGKLA